jgi:hypothetical protein
LLAEAIPSGQLFDDVTEKRAIAIIGKAGFAGALDAPPEILLEMVEAKNVAVNEAPVERLFDQHYQIAHAKHCYGALPADPDIALCLWPYLDESVAQELARDCPIEFSS